MKLWNWRAWQAHWWEDGPGKDVDAPNAVIMEAWERALEERLAEEKDDARRGAAVLSRLGYPQPPLPPPRRWYDSEEKRFRFPRTRRTDAA